MKKLLTTIISLSVVILIVLGATGVFNSKAKTYDEIIKLGAAFALSGDAAEWGEMSLKGAELAVKEINEAGGIHGSFVELSVEDTGSNSRQSLSAVSKLANIDKVDAIVGPSWLDVYHGPGAVAKDANIVMITPDSGTEAINDGKKLTNVYSTWYRVAPKAELLTETIAENNFESLFILVPNDSYYIYFADFLRQFSQEQEITIVGQEIFNSDSDLRAEMLKIAKSEADAVFFASYEEKHFAEYAKSIKSIAPNMQLYGDEVTKDFVDQGKYIDQLEGVVYFHASQPQSAFVKTFEEEYGLQPVFGAATTYDSVYILAEAIEKKKDSESIADYLERTTFKTVSYGDVSFDEIGGVKTEKQQYDLFELKNGDVRKIN